MKNEIILIDARILKPTQICLGFKEIESNLNIFRNCTNEEYIKILNHKIVPVVKGYNCILKRYAKIHKNDFFY